MNNKVWLKVLRKIADEEEIPFSRVPKSVREKLQQWGESSGAVSLQRSQAGAGRVFKVINLRIVEKEIVSLDPNVDVNAHIIFVRRLEIKWLLMELMFLRCQKR